MPESFCIFFFLRIDIKNKHLIQNAVTVKVNVKYFSVFKCHQNEGPAEPRFGFQNPPYFWGLGVGMYDT